MPNNSQTSSPTVSQMMKEGCAELHEQAEQSAVPQRMVSGTMTQPEFAEMTAQMSVWNAALDDALRRHLDTVPAFKALISDEQFQSQYYDADLKHHGIDPATIQPSPAVEAMTRVVEQFADENPLKLLGLHYVREGANNGNHYVAKKLREAWGTTGAEGMRTLDPYGNQQRKKWEQFKATLDAQPWTDQERAMLLDAGKAAFEGIIAIHKDLEGSLASA